MTVNVTDTVGANNTIVLDSSSKIPVIDGSQVTALSASAFTTGSLATARIDVGTAAGKVLQLDGSARIPALSGVNLTGIGGATSSTSDPTISTNPTLGAKWINKTSGKVYICTDATTGANVWTNVGLGTVNVAPSTLPRQGTQYGYHSGGGHPRTNSILKYSYTSDVNAVDTTADLTEAQNTSGSSNTCSSTYGYMAGHQTNAVNTNVIEKWPFASNSNATDVGNLSALVYGAIGASSNTHGYTQGGGQSGPKINEIQRWSFSSDGNASDVGDMTGVRAHGASSMTETYGYSHGGQQVTPVGPTNVVNIIEKFAFGSSSNSTDVGDLNKGTNNCSGQQSETHGYSSGGSHYNTSDPYGHDQIMKYSFSTDGNSTDIANLLENLNVTAGSSQTNYGYTSGGQFQDSPFPYRNTIQKFSFTTDGNSTDVGDLTAVLVGGAGCQV